MKAAITKLLLLALLCAPAAQCLAQAYPAKTIRFIVGYLPGGGNDVLARLVGLKLQEAWKQPVVIENKPGADTIIATDYVAKSAPDGYTLLVNAMGGMTITPAIHAKLPFDTVKDFIPIGALARFPHLLVVNPSLPVNSVRELIAYAKANPGKINYGSASNAIRIATEILAQRTGLSLVHIPYKGSSASTGALLANDVQMAISDAPPLMVHIRAGKLKALAVTSDTRLEALPDLPTVADAANLPGYEITPWIGLFAPAGTPPAVITALNTELVRIVTSPDVRSRLTAMGAEPVGDSPQRFAEKVRSEISRFSAAARALNITAQ